MLQYAKYRTFDLEVSLGMDLNFNKLFTCKLLCMLCHFMILNMERAYILCMLLYITTSSIAGYATWEQSSSKCRFVANQGSKSYKPVIVQMFCNCVNMVCGNLIVDSI